MPDIPETTFENIEGGESGDALVIALSAIAVYAIYEVSNMAFSKKARRAIFERDGGHCTDEGCDRSYADGWVMHASHICHEKGEHYSDPDNGRLQCVEHHRLFHEGMGRLATEAGDRRSSIFHRIAAALLGRSSERR